MMRSTDRIISSSRGSPETAIAWCRTHGAYRMDDVEALIHEFYRLGPLVGIDASIAIAQSVHETGNFTNIWWLQRLNSGSLGLTGDPVQNAASRTWTRGVDSARSQMAHLQLYATGKITGGGLITDMDPRYYAYIAAYGHTVQAETIADLAGKWAVDPDYAAGICARGDAIYPDLPDQEEQPMPVPFAVNVDVNLIHRGNTPLANADAWYTIHNTGNTVNADAERSFFANGGGTSGVLVHLLVDESKIIQITELWKQGIHAGNVNGNKTSIAMEMCARRSVFNDVEHNGAKAMAMIYTRDPRLDWSGAEHVTFSPERTTDHRGWAGANPACPAVLIERHGSADVKFMVDLARIYMKGVTPAPVPKPMPHLVGGEVQRDGKTFIDASGNTWIWLYKMMTPTKAVQTYEYANVDAARKGPVMAAGKAARVYYAVAVNDPDGTPDVWGTTRLGWRFSMSSMLAT